MFAEVGGVFMLLHEYCKSLFKIGPHIGMKNFENSK